MAGFFCQEVILSSIYIIETFKNLHTSLHADTRTTMRQLAAVNAVIIVYVTLPAIRQYRICVP